MKMKLKTTFTAAAITIAGFLSWNASAATSTSAPADSCYQTFRVGVPLVVVCMMDQEFENDNATVAMIDRNDDISFCQRSSRFAKQNDAMMFRFAGAPAMIIDPQSILNRVEQGVIYIGPNPLQYTKINSQHTTDFVKQIQSEGRCPN